MGAVGGDYSLSAAGLMNEKAHPVCPEKNSGVMREFSSCSLDLPIIHKRHSPLVQGWNHDLCPLGAFKV